MQKSVEMVNIYANTVPFKGLTFHTADFDPEDEPFAKDLESNEESDGNESIDASTGREHYEMVGKSKLRKPEKTTLDEKKYDGQAVSRDQIFQDNDIDNALAPEDDEDEDPFAIKDQAVSGSEDEREGLSVNDDLMNGVEIDEDGEGDEELDSDEAFEEGEEDSFRGKGFVFRGSGQNLAKLPGSSDEAEDVDLEDDENLEGSDTYEDDSDLDMDGVNGMNEDKSDIEEGDESEDDLEEDEAKDDSDEDDEAVARPRPGTIKATGTSDREKVKALISNDTAALASSLSASLAADAQKGAAVKKQYQTFDRLLDARIKLQRGLTATNDLNFSGTVSDEEAQAALVKAEEAALKLYTTIESLRHSILEANTPTTKSSNKRKRPSPPTPKTTSTDLWTRISNLEAQALPTRQQTLDKWSSKTRTAQPTPSSKLSDPSSTSAAHNSKLSTVLTTYLITETPKLIQSNNHPTPTSTIPYDDTTFYQSLLRDLINSRAAAAATSSSLIGTSIPIVPLKLHPSGNTSKNRKIDTKASKGRKIRYTVHEKLENFMAAEGRGNMVGQWNDGAVREFFGSLLGQRGLLGEEDDGELNGDGEGGEDREMEALRLFRT